MGVMCDAVGQCELFDAMDLTPPALAEVRRAAAAGDGAAAVAAFAAYLRRRTGIPAILDSGDQRCAPRDITRADDIVNGLVRVIRYTHRFPGGEIDWLFNATAGRDDVAMTPEWQWQLNRMLFWPDLADAYAASGDERYAQAWVRHLRSWARQAPMPGEGEHHSCWRTLDAGLRMSGAWPHAFHLFLHSRSVSDEDLWLFARLCLDHGRFLCRSKNRWPNQLAMEMEGLYAVGCLFPEFREAAEWRGRAVRTMHQQLGEQFLPDGAHVELSTSYHNVTLDSALAIVKWARLCDRFNEIPEDYLRRAERAFDFDLYFMAPDRLLPLVNDCWVWDAQAAMRAATQWFPQRADFACVASDGERGCFPEVASHYFPYGGFAVMRSGWGRDANMLVFDVGPLGKHHAHEDKLQVLLWAFGRQVLFDGGGGIYEKSKWRDYAVLTHSHNTALVDGRGQFRSPNRGVDRVTPDPIDAGWTSLPDTDYARGVYEGPYGNDGARPARHERQALFLKPDVYVVWDRLNSADGRQHTYEVRWHLDTVQTECGEKDAVLTADAGQANLLLVPLQRDGLECSIAKAQTEPELLGWRIDKSGQHPASTVRHVKRGLAGEFLTLLLPQRAGAVIRGVRNVRWQSTNLVEVELTDGSTLEIRTGGSSETKLQARLLHSARA